MAHHFSDGKFLRVRYLRSSKCERGPSLPPVEEKYNWMIKICHAAKPDDTFGGSSIYFAKMRVKDSVRRRGFSKPKAELGSGVPAVDWMWNGRRVTGLVAPKGLRR